jgi:hypothetical protein
MVNMVEEDNSGILRIRGVVKDCKTLDIEEERALFRIGVDYTSVSASGPRYPGPCELSTTSKILDHDNNIRIFGASIASALAQW